MHRLLLLTTVTAWAAPPASLTCTVVDDLSGASIMRVRVALTGGKLAQPLITYTDGNGAAQFGDLAEGTYRLSLDKAGYFGFDEESTALPVELRSGAVTETGKIVLTRKRRIRGLVRNSQGEPAARVRVTAHPGNTSMQTGEDGEFHLQSLSPGRYRIAAATTDPADCCRVALPEESIDLRNRGESEGHLLVLREGPGVRLEGKVLSSALVPEGTPVTVLLRVADAPLPILAIARAEAGKAFRLSAPEGAFHLQVNTHTPPMRGAAQIVQVGRQPISGLTLAVTDATLAGQLVVDGGALPAERVWLFATSPRFPIAVSGPSGEGGSFRLEGGFAGERYTMRMDPAPGFYAASVEQDFGEPGFVVAGGGPIRITLKPDGGEVSGLVKFERDDVAKALVLMAPETATGLTRCRMRLVSRTNSTFTFGDVPPGKYRLYAFDRDVSESCDDADYLRPFEPKPLTVKPRGGVSAELKLIRNARAPR